MEPLWMLYLNQDANNSGGEKMAEQKATVLVNLLRDTLRRITLVGSWFDDRSIDRPAGPCSDMKTELAAIFCTPNPRRRFDIVRRSR